MLDLAPLMNKDDDGEAEGGGGGGGLKMGAVCRCLLCPSVVYVGVVLSPLSSGWSLLCEPSVMLFLVPGRMLCCLVL
jgi:hypothetical protein